MSDSGAGIDSPSNASDGTARNSIPERLRAAGLTEIGCLLAWLDWRNLWQGSIALAPTEDLEVTLLGILRQAEYIAAQQLGRSSLRPPSNDRPLPGPGEPWTLSAALGEEVLLIELCEQTASGLLREEASHEEALEMWQVLAVGECEAFLRAELLDHHLDPKWARHADDVIPRIMESHSISQGFYLCWLAVRDVASAYLKHPHARENLGLTLRSSLEQKLGRAIAERWTLKRFARHARSPESALSAAFARMTALEQEFLQAIPSRLRLLRFRGE